VSEYPKYLFNCGHKCRITEAGYQKNTSIRVCPECGESKGIKLYKCKECGRIFKKQKHTGNCKYCDSAACKKKGNEKTKVRKTKTDIENKIRKAHLEASIHTHDCIHREHCINAMVGDFIPCFECTYYTRYNSTVENYLSSVDYNYGDSFYCSVNSSF